MSLGLSLPSAKVSAFLVLVFLGFGVLIGRTTRQPQDARAASVGRIVTVASPTTAPSASSAPTSSSSTAGGEPPEVEAEPTPAPAAGATKRSAAKTRTPSHEKRSRKPGASHGAGGSGEAAAGAPAIKLPAIKHVFVIVLSNQPYAAVFGPESSARYLAHTLERQGELLTRYDAVAHEELANGVALLSGQGPTADTAANCATYAAISPATIGASEQALGNGCVYPPSTQTLPGQLTAKRLTWRAYVQGIDEGGATAGACAHPALGQPDPTSATSGGTGAYATFRNPLVYFQSLVDTPSCAANDVGLDRLKPDLRSASRTPSFSLIIPDRCHDGNPTPCTAGAPAGLGPADAFLQRIVPEITASKAYKRDGLLAITVDQAPSSGEFADSSSCCGQPRFPNLTVGLSPRGGGTVGALLLSPYVKAGATSQEPFNHFSLLRTIEDLFGLGHLGYAALPAVKPFSPGMFTAAKN
ncbi:MAG TPA: alkaline phosphatase family protein [Solirubrobacteraceae bacterium]|nr:alkaline phosphatase family protein [Solirubrobacteraceae bacterium]